MIFIPVLFVCMNDRCEFMQSNKYFTRESECRAAAEEQKEGLRRMSLKAGHMITLIEGACVIAKNGAL
jgi:hypothetical protein